MGETLLGHEYMKDSDQSAVVHPIAAVKLVDLLQVHPEFRCPSHAQRKLDESGIEVWTPSGA